MVSPDGAHNIYLLSASFHQTDGYYPPIYRSGLACESESNLLLLGIFVANLPQGHSGLLFIIVTVASTPQLILYHKSSLLNPHRG